MGRGWLLPVGPAVLAVAFAGCSSDKPGPGGTAGSGQSASGAPGTAGNPGTPVAGATAVAGSGATAGAGSPTAGSGGAPGGAGSSAAGARTAGASTGGASTGGTTGSAGAAGAAGGTSSTGITVKLDATHQTIQGFGLNDALISATWSTQTLDNLFTTKGDTGIGLQVLRIGMNSTGGIAGSTASNISGAKSRGAKIIGSCWSPPADFKKGQPDPTSMNGGGHVTADKYDAWSSTIAKFAKDNGLYAMSIGNEPDFASCGSAEPCNGQYETTLYTAKEMVAFLKIAGPKLQANNVKVIAPEASEWVHQWSNESAKGSEPGNKPSSDPLKCGFPASNTACANGDGYDYGHWMAKDADAWKALDIIGVHEYDSQHAEPWPADVNGGKRDKEIWQTEMSGVKWWPEQGPSDTIANGVAVAGWIHSALVVGEASAWLYWWYSAYGTDDNEGLTRKNSETLTKRYYALGNYSKFVRPTYVMVSVTGNSSTDVLLSAFKGPTDGTVVVVAINKGAAAATVPITISGGTAPATMTPNVTSATENLKAGTAVPVTGGVLMASLPSKTITTFVGK